MSSPHDPPVSVPAGSGSPADAEEFDLVGVGTGPFNLALAALADRVDGLRTLFLDEKPTFSWHAGMLLDGATLQVPFLADLVTLTDPTSPWSYLAYLREHDRLFPFYFTERFHIPRREYDDYCRWVARSLPSCRASSRVDALDWDAAAEAFRITYTDTATGRRHTVRGRDVVLGVGTSPVVPEALRPLLGTRVFHSAGYLAGRPSLEGLRDVTVVGSGQSGAEVLLDLLRTPPSPDTRLHWITRAPAFAPMEYSKLGLEHFTPDYTAYFHGLPEQTRERLVPSQWQLYKAISADTIAEIYDALYDRAAASGGDAGATLHPNVEVRSAEQGPDGLRLECRHREQDRVFTLGTDAVVLATGYAARRPALLEPVADLVDWDERGGYRVESDYRVRLRPDVAGRIYVQNAELHTHGVGAPDLGLGAHRAAMILNSLTGRTVYRLPRRTAFTTFGAPDQGVGAETGSADAAPDAPAPSPVPRTVPSPPRRPLPIATGGHV